MAGVTATAVPATQRRRGHLRAMMQAMFDAATEPGEPLAMLSASEGSIDGRFGLGPVTYRARWEIARHEASLLPAAEDDGSPPADRWEGLSDEAHGTAGPNRYLIHRSRDGAVDGIATFRLP